MTTRLASRIISTLGLAATVPLVILSIACYLVISISVLATHIISRLGYRILDIVDRHESLARAADRQRSQCTTPQDPHP